MQTASVALASNSEATPGLHPPSAYPTCTTPTTGRAAAQAPVFMFAWSVTVIHTSCPPALSCCLCTGVPQQSHWFTWQGCSWQLSCRCDPTSDSLAVRITFSPKDADRCTAYIALQAVDRREGQDCTRYLPRQEFTEQQPSAVHEEFLQLSELQQSRCPYLMNDSLMIIAHLSTAPMSEQQAAGNMQENPFNFPSSRNSLKARGVAAAAGNPAGSLLPAAPSPFASMFSGDLTRFLSGTAFAEVRLSALSAAGDASAQQQQYQLSTPMLCHASRLTRVSDTLRLRLGPVLKTLPARPHGYGGTDAQPLVLLDAPLPVLRVFHKMLYEASVSVPAALLPGLLQLAVLFDMPELELWVLRQAHTAGDKLMIPTGVLTLLLSQ